MSVLFDMLGDCGKQVGWRHKQNNHCMHGRQVSCSRAPAPPSLPTPHSSEKDLLASRHLGVLQLVGRGSDASSANHACSATWVSYRVSLDGMGFQSNMGALRMQGVHKPVKRAGATHARHAGIKCCAGDTLIANRRARRLCVCRFGRGSQAARRTEPGACVAKQRH